MRMTRKIRRAWLRGKPEWAKCYSLKARMRKQSKRIAYQEKKVKLHSYSRYLVAGVLLACLGMGQSVANASEITASAGVVDNVIHNATHVYDIYNQQVSNGSALNKFDKFNLFADDIANLQLGQHTVGDVTYQAADRQINLVTDKVVINGVLNALKDNQIGGDIYFFSDKGIAVGATGVINVGSLTLGTSTAAGQSIYNDWTSYNNKTSLQKAQFIVGSSENVADNLISVNGIINSVGDVILGAKKIDVSGDAKINAGVSFESTNKAKTDTQSFDEYKAQFMNLNGVESASLAVKASSGEIVLFGKSGIDFSSEDTISITGNDSKYVKLVTIGGDIDITASRNSMGDTVVNITDANLDATDKTSGGNAHGNVNVTASTTTNTFSWAMDGSDAEVNIVGSTLTGDNVNVSAFASTSGKLSSDDDITDTEISDAIEQGNHRLLNAVKELALDNALNLRTIATATKVHANAEVNILDSNLTAVGNSQNDINVKHGDIKVQALASSEINTIGFGPIGYSATAGISDVNASVNIGSKENSSIGSTLTAQNDVVLYANGENSVDLYYLDLALTDTFTYSSAATNWAEVNSNVSVRVDDNSKLYATNDVNITSNSIRALSNSACAGGDADYLGVTTSISLADTKAETIIDGDIFADGDINVSAYNSVAQDEDGYYTPDTSIAESLSGDTFMGKSIAVGAKNAISGLVGVITDGEHHLIDVNAVPSKGSEFGVNAATAVLSSVNVAKAEVNGTVAGKTESSAANSLTVNAETISRSNVVAMAYQNELTKVSDGTAGSKDYGVASGVNVGVTKNFSIASVNGNVNIANDLDVKSKTKVPWQSASWSSNDASPFAVTTTLITNLFTSRNAGMSDVVDSWAQSNNSTDKAAFAASIGFMEYDNKSEAFIGSDAELTVGGNLDVSALNEIITANFAGNISSPINMMPLGFLWKYTWGYQKDIIKPNLWGNENTQYASLGGSAVAVHQSNNAKAYIADGATIITADRLDVRADNRAANIVFTAAGGKSNGLALDATIGVTRTENQASAYIGKADVNISDDVRVKATDNAIIANIGGAINKSGGSAGIGATITYSHIERDTRAYITGNVDAGNGVIIEAKNTGEILAATVAGSETVDSRSDTASGSVGLQGTATSTANNNLQADSSDPLTNTVQKLLNTNVTANTNKKNLSVDTGDTTITNVTNRNQGTGAKSAKNSFAIAGNTAVNKIDDKALAYIDGEGTVENSTVIADYVRVSSINDSEIASVALATALDFSVGDASTGIAGSFMYNSIASENKAFVEDVTLELAGNTSSEIDESLTIDAQNEESIFNMAASGSVAPKGNGVVGQISINDIDSITNAHLKNANINAVEKITVKAKDDAKIQSLTGAVTITGSLVGLGAAIGVQDISTQTIASIENSVISGTQGTNSKAGNIEVSAEEKSDITSIVVAGSIGANTKMAAAASDSTSVVSTITEAYIDNDENIKAAAIQVAAKNLANATVGVGQISVAQNSFGASTAQMLSTNYVEAYIKGDAIKNNIIEADSISVQAENIYNGSAKESNEDNTTAKTIAVGGAVGAGTASGLGSVTVNIIDNDTKAYLDAGKYLVDGNVNVTADSQAYMFGLAGGVSVGKAAGVGAAVDTQMLDALTEAYIADNVTISKAGDITVDASSMEKITSVAAIASGGGNFAGSAAANAHDIDVTTIAHIGSNNTSNEEAGSDNGNTQAVLSSLTNVGTVTVTANDNAELSANAGSAAVQAGSGGAAISGSAAVELLDKTVKAYVENTKINAQDLNVIAKNTGKIINTATGIALAISEYGGAGSGSESESIVNYVTDAHVAGDSTITVADDLVIDVDSSFEHIGVATALAGSSWVGIGLSNDTTVLTMTTSSYVGDGSDVTAGDDVNITADNVVDITSAVASGSAAIVAANGGVGVNIIDSTTQAYVGSESSVTANNDVNDELSGIVLHAQDDTIIEGGSGGATLGAANAGASVNVNDVFKNTLAYVGCGSDLNTKGATNIEAINNEKILNVTVQGTGGLGVGLAGAVAVHDLDVITKAYTDTNVDINQGDAYANAQDINVSATHNLGISSCVVGASLGAGAIGAAVDVANVITQTNAYIGDGSKVTTAGDLQVTADEAIGDFEYTNDENVSETAEMKSIVVAGAVGIGSISGSVSVYNFGSGMSEADTALLNATDADGNSQSFDDWLSGQINQSNTKETLSAYENNSVATKVGAAVDERSFTTTVVANASTIGEAGVVAKLGKNLVVNAANVEVSTDGNVKMKVEAGTGSAGAVAAGASVGVVHNNTKVSGIVDNGTSLTANGEFNLEAEGNTVLDGKVIAPAVGVVAGSAAALDLNSDVDVTAKVNDGAVINAQSIVVKALNTPKLNAYATGVGVGIAGVGTVEALVSSKDSANVLVGNDVTLKATGTSENEGDIEILAATQNADVYNAYVKAEAGSGGVLNGSVTVSQIELDNTTKVSVGQRVRISGKKVDIQAKHEDAFNYENISAGVGGFSGLGSNNRVKVNSDVAVSIGASGGTATVSDDKASITSSETTIIKAENITTKDWLNANANDAVGESDYNALSVGASLAGGTGIKNVTEITHATDVTLGNVVVQANAVPLTSEELSAGVKLADRNAHTIDAHSDITSKDYQYIGTGAVVEAAHIDDSNKVKADTTVNIGAAAELYAGDVDMADTTTKLNKELTNGTYDASDVGGGKIAIGAKNNADIYSKTIVNAWGAAGYTGTSNNVSYDNTITTNVDGKLETANGDIALNVGSDSANTLGIVNVNADSKLLNSTIIPISVEPDPIATVNSTAKLIVGSNANVLSDRDIYLKANAGNTTALGYGEIKDWAHAMADDIGAKNSITGSEVVNTSADVVVDSYVETGIHRNQSVVICGTPVDASVTMGDDTYNKKVWQTTVEHTAGIGFEYQDNVAIASAYKTRLTELRELCSLYSADDGAVAAYEAEIQLIMDKMVENGFAYYETYTEGGKTKTAFIMFADEFLLTNKVTIKDTQVRLGNIVVEADNLYGNGTLNAGADAEVNIINNSPNNLVVNDILISSDSEGTVNSLYDGGYVIYNNASVSDAGDISARNDGVVPNFAAINSKDNSSDKTTLQISNTFSPSSYTTKDNASNVVKWFAAPSLTIAEGAEIYNTKGDVAITSAYGDVNNMGTINAGSVSIQATNGDYTQTAAGRIVDIGGSPVGYEDNGNEEYGNGILANGNVYISARYINITSNIRSGVGYYGWSIVIPEEPTFYKNGNKDTTYTIAQIDAMADKATGTFTLANGSADAFADSACGQVTYDALSKRIVVDGIETNGGYVELVGTILNTVHSSSDKGKISVLDGSSKVNIVNKSNVDLELKNISTGENVEGVIKITDLDFKTGEKTRTTTYTRKDGVITTAVQTYTDGVVGNEVTSTVNGSKITYNLEELYYVWQKAYDSTIVTEYHYSDSKPVIWWEDGDFSGATSTHDVISTTNSEEQLVQPNGTFITNTHVPNPGDGINVSNAFVNGGYYQYEYTIHTSSEKYDERTETNRLWYTLGIVKEYDHWYKVKDGYTTVTHTAIDASRPVTIEFNGDEKGGDFDVTSNNSDVYVSGNVKNTGGFADVSAQNIYQGSNGFIDTGNLELTASGSIGTANAALLTNAAELGNIKASNGSVYIYDTNDKVELSVGVKDNAAIVAGDVVSITAAGDISSVQNSPLGISTNIRANRIELTSKNGSIKDLSVRVGNVEKTAAYGLKVSAVGDIDIANHSGDLYVDSVISKNGNVHLSTNGSFIDNNFTDVIEDDVKKLVESYKNAQVLENQETTSNLQKNALVSAAQAKYNRYQALKKSVINGKFTLNEVDKAALQKLGFTAEQVDAYIAERQAEFDQLKAFGADGWNKDALETYKTNLEASNDAVFANANLQAQDVTADTFLTAKERAAVLVGSARRDGELVAGVSGSIFKDVTDTTLTRKAVPNVKGKQVRLTVREVAGNVGSTETITTTEADLKAILNKAFTDYSAVTADEKKILQALQSAEYGETIVDDNGNIIFKVVDALVVEADDLNVRGLSVNYQGQTYGKGSVENVYVNSEKTISFDAINVNGEVHLKSDDGIDGRAINTNGDVVLEGSNGTIGNMDAGVLKAMILGSNSQKLTARAKGDIHLLKNGDLEVKVIYSKDGEIILDVDGKITGHGATPGIGIKHYNSNNVITASLYGENDVEKDAKEELDEESNVKDTSITSSEVNADEEFTTI
ncbi:MAG: leukotoxin LktA family filamentous adhesin [Phascolarctobacterium sp.]|nr:leukotoxin LktA family filamentous adhesin [Phascolarctobacterium sp.]